VRKIGKEASSHPGIFSRTLRFYNVASSPGSPRPHLLEGHRKLVGSSAIPGRVFCFLFWFRIHTASAPSTAGTSTHGGAVIREPLARRHSRNGPWNTWQTHTHVVK